jgi:hypothetical protein
VLYLVKLEGVNTRLSAVAFKEFSVFVRLEDRPALKEDEYLIRDLVDIPVYIRIPPIPVASVIPTVAAENDVKAKTTVEKKGRLIGRAKGNKIQNKDSESSSEQRQEIVTKSTNGIQSASESVPESKLQHQIQLIGVVAGVVTPDELCDPSLAALMHAMLEVRLTEKYMPDAKEIAEGEVPGDIMCLIPLVPSIVTTVIASGDDRKIIIDPPEGLLDLTYVERRKLVVRGFLPAKSLSLTEEEREELRSISILQYPE